MRVRIMNQNTVNAGLEVAQRLAQALPSVLPNATFLVKGVRITSAQAAAQVAQHVANERALIALRGRIRAAEADIYVERAHVKAALQAVKIGATAALGDTSTEFQALGFTPPKPRKTSAAARAEAVEKSLATRAARGTRGKRQRAAIRGTPPAT